MARSAYVYTVFDEVNYGYGRLLGTFTVKYEMVQCTEKWLRQNLLQGRLAIYRSRDGRMSSPLPITEQFNFNVAQA